MSRWKRVLAELAVALVIAAQFFVLPYLECREYGIDEPALSDWMTAPTFAKPTVNADAVLAGIKARMNACCGAGYATWCKHIRGYEYSAPVKN